MRKLVVFGDSYVEGQRKDPHLMITEFNPCYYLAKELGTEVINKGKFASCNQTIANEVFRYCKQNDVRNTAMLVVWSDVRRQSCVNLRIEGNKLLDFDSWQYVSSMGQVELEERMNLREIGNPAMHRMHFEQAMHSVRMICQDYGIPLIMTNSIDTVPFLNHVFWETKDRPIRYNLGESKTQWIEGDKTNNSMFDIVTGRWLREDIPDLTFHKKHSMIRNHYNQNKDKYPYLTKCFHPWDEGNELIAKTLAPYIKKIIEEDE